MRRAPSSFASGRTRAALSAPLVDPAHSIDRVDDEIEKHLKGDTYAFINFAEDVQDLMIEMIVNLLKHKNPHTGLVYAQDPALAFIEL